MKANNRSHRSLRTLKPKFKHKCVMLGESGVGKSNIVQRFAYDRYTETLESTVGVAYHTKQIATRDGPILFELWDTAGQERYRALSPMYFRSANSAIVVYDIASMESFRVAKSFVTEVLEYFEMREESLRSGGALAPGMAAAEMSAEPPFIVLVGNKIDREEERQVLAKVAIEYATTVDAAFVETSCLLGTHVETIFQIVAQKARHTPLDTKAGGVALPSRSSDEPEESKCCG